MKIDVLSDEVIQQGTKEKENIGEMEEKSSISGTQTEKSLSHSTPRKESLRVKIIKLQKEIAEKNKIIASLKKNNSSEEVFIENAHRLLSPELAKIVENQVKNSKRFQKGYRHSDDIKQFALKIYFISPACYRNISECMTLPSKTTLENYISSWPSKPGVVK